MSLPLVLGVMSGGTLLAAGSVVAIQQINDQHDQKRLSLVSFIENRKWEGKGKFIGLRGGVNWNKKLQEYKAHVERLDSIDRNMYPPMSRALGFKNLDTVDDLKRWCMGIMFKNNSWNSEEDGNTKFCAEERINPNIKLIEA